MTVPDGGVATSADNTASSRCASALVSTPKPSHVCGKCLRVLDTKLPSLSCDHVVLVTTLALALSAALAANPVPYGSSTVSVQNGARGRAAMGVVPPFGGRWKGQ